MIMRVIAVFFSACLLGGCTDSEWDNALHYVGLGPTAAPAPGRTAPANETAAATAPAAAPAAAPATPVATQPAATGEADVWCRQVAKSAREDAASEGFDAATQERRQQTAYEQCIRYLGTKMQ